MIILSQTKSRISGWSKGIAHQISCSFGGRFFISQLFFLKFWLEGRESVSFISSF